MESVLNWLWQGATVAIAAAVMLRFMEPSRALIRYRSLWVILLTILLLPVVPFLWSVMLPARDAAGLPAPSDSIVTIPAGWWTSTNVMIALSAAWSMTYAGRVARAALALRRAKQQCQAVPRGLEARLRCWSEVRTTGRRARLVLSASVKSAAVLGGRSPFIALAPSLVDHLTHRELDRVVIHEWAHVQRRDDAAHLLQLLVRALAGWHPAIWWCDRQLNVEREIACDEMAVAITGSSKEYAACLTRVASVPSLSARPLAAAVALSTSGLHQRIVRILSFDRMAARPTRIGGAIVAGVALGITALSVGAFRPVGTERFSAGDRSVIGMGIGHGSMTEPAATDSPAVSRELLEAPRRPDEAGTRLARRSQPRAAVDSATNSPSAPTSPVTPVDGSPASVVNDSRSPEQIGSPLASRAAVVPAAFDSAVGLVGPIAAAPTADLSRRSGTAAEADALLSVGVQPVSPWTAAADAGVAVGRGTQQAAATTAGVFNRLARKIAGSF